MQSRMSIRSLLFTKKSTKSKLRPKKILLQKAKLPVSATFTYQILDTDEIVTSLSSTKLLNTP